jgi:ABC-type antimicrobial peptide transport system permease subunit
MLTDDKLLTGTDIVSIKVHDGDDASCFNLNRAQSPRLLGVPVNILAERRAFLPRHAGTELWALLNEELPDGTVPALVGDSNTAMWGLKKKVGPDKGDTLFYTDERGNTFKVKLVGKLPMRLSVFQGTILISMQNFNRLYPSEAGHRMFLFDADGKDVNELRTTLSERLDRIGLDMTTTTERMQAFYSVETTYLAMFLMLGGLGLLLGSIGMGIVVLRNMLERRSELALLKCLGFSGNQIVRIIVAEHWLLLLAGLIVGVVSAAIAMWPSLHSPSVSVPYGTLGVLLGSVLVIGLLWTSIAARLAVRRPLIPALRNE